MRRLRSCKVRSRPISGGTRHHRRRPVIVPARLRTDTRAPACWQSSATEHDTNVSAKTRKNSTPGPARITGASAQEEAVRGDGAAHNDRLSTR